MKKTLLLAVSTLALSATIAHARCDYPDDLDSAGRRCGGRAASVRPGGRLGGNGQYQDSYGRDRIYGKDNDPYDRSYNSGNNYNSNQYNQGRNGLYQ
ncbi:MAG: hypothetical protein JXR30_01880 [Alphaproteobacteria bacterium]|nr:hypothetical protein [Alphaproteobacteria bacterium]